MNALRWKGCPSTTTRGTTSTGSSNASAEHSVNVIPVSLAATMATTMATASASAAVAAAQSIPITAMTTPARDNADAVHEEPATAVRNLNVAIDVDAVQCAMCLKASAFEADFGKAFFCPGHVDGKSVKYAGLLVECYRSWFKERPITPDSVRRTHAKRASMLAKLQRQHKLHYHKLKDVCMEICTAFSAATSFVSLADKDLELIVGSYGSMLHPSCIPREIGMCDYAMGSSEQHLLVNNVPEDSVFRENPMLRAVKAQFYFGIPICVDRTAVGVIAVLDAMPRADPPDPLAIALMKQKADMMGSRVSALLCDSSPSSFSSRMLDQR